MVSLGFVEGWSRGFSGVGLRFFEGLSRVGLGFT